MCEGWLLLVKDSGVVLFNGRAVSVFTALTLLTSLLYFLFPPSPLYQVQQVFLLRMDMGRGWGLGSVLGRVVGWADGRGSDVDIKT